MARHGRKSEAAVLVRVRQHLLVPVRDARRGRRAAAGVALAWRPFLLGPIFAAQGWNDSPFNVYPAKGRYMWRDLARICERLGVALQRPSRLPAQRPPRRARRAIAADEGWAPDFVRAVYSANFADDARSASRR